MRPLLQLQMMVKDEAKSIRGVLDSVKPYIDSWLIMDTGSTDGTQEIIREVLKDIPGSLVLDQFTGYMDTRNRILALGAQEKDAPVFTLMMNGDENLHDGDKLRETLESQRDSGVDCYCMKLALDDGLSYQARVIRNGSPWRYEDFDCGVDEVPVHPTEQARADGLATGWIEHVVADPIKRMDNVWENHIPKLQAALERNPKNDRAIELMIQKISSFFFVMEKDELEAATLKCCDLYSQRFELPFKHEEHKRVMMMNFIDTARLGNVMPLEELFTLADELCKSDDSRPEPFLLRAVLASNNPKSKTAEVYNYAREAAVVAEKVRLAGGLKTSAPLDMSAEWKAHRLAAIAAANMGKKYPQQIELARDHIAAGISTGGPWELFKNILEQAGAGA